MGVTPCVEVDRIRFSYRGNACLEDVSFTVGTGETLCLLGPNGSGKTTLLRCLLALSELESGSVRINGHDAHRVSRRVLARQIAYVPQSSAVIFPFTVFDIALMGRTAHLEGLAMPSAKDERYALQALGQLGIEHLKDRPFQQISGGERQLVLIARALCQEAPVVVMDEPTASLDYGNQIRVLKILNELRQSGYTVIVSAHNPDHAFISATHAAIIQRGRIIAYGEPEGIITSESLSDLYGAPIRVISAQLTADQGKAATICVPVM